MSMIDSDVGYLAMEEALAECKSALQAEIAKRQVREREAAKAYADKRALVEALREMIDADTFCAGSGHDAKSRIRYAKAVTKALDTLKGAE